MDTKQGASVPENGKWFLMEHKDKNCGCAFSINLKKYLQAVRKETGFKPMPKCPGCGASFSHEALVDFLGAYEKFNKHLSQGDQNCTNREIRKPINSENIEF